MTQSPEVRAAHNELMSAFEAFRSANDQRLAEIEQKSSADVLLQEKVDRIDRSLNRAQASLDRLSLAGLRPGTQPAVDLERQEAKAAWAGFMRRGDESALVAIEAKSLSVGVASDGGHVAPPEVQATIDRRIIASSPMRRLASIRTTSANIFRKPIAISAPAVGWVAETGTRTETATPSLDLLSFPMGEIYAMAAATQTLLDDALLDMDQWLAGEIAESFSSAESIAFISGDGVNKPKGLLAYTAAPDASATWGQLGYLASGVAGAFPAANPVDKLVDLTYAPKTPYRANASFLMNRRTVGLVRKFKDSSGQYIWQPSLVAGQPATLLGFPVVECEDMPDVNASGLAIAFGDFEKGYLIVDRADVRVLRDPYTNKPFVMFYVTKRLGGGVQNFDAIKLLKFTVS
ncbi:MAG: phage major capsid protein [Aquidulcibacter sp.]|uniref:phage major capsid protein n=1 Tax=Aquidulcibacter sp. TaxID=2052990 RepID=UPI0022C8DB9F|nr:phage major capsid protein [Aquidulcibacter sp.]MCE2890344.1 phage major capsid protein [Hyphomonadaceae bacterium]MCZ8210060.1 phage major capsid protein [Aquidulcibacter sp.]